MSENFPLWAEAPDEEVIQIVPAAAGWRLCMTYHDDMETLVDERPIAMFALVGARDEEGKFTSNRCMQPVVVWDSLDLDWPGHWGYQAEDGLVLGPGEPLTDEIRQQLVADALRKDEDEKRLYEAGKAAKDRVLAAITDESQDAWAIIAKSGVEFRVATEAICCLYREKAITRSGTRRSDQALLWRRTATVAR